MVARTALVVARSALTRPPGRAVARTTLTRPPGRAVARIRDVPALDGSRRIGVDSGRDKPVLYDGVASTSLKNPVGKN